ncbi:hypothetical protein N7540_000487 [Penicillium herquei]|nr:hypothetical protein N7540_000487 [Penicillium herquei]
MDGLPAKRPVCQFIEEQCCQFIEQELDKYEDTGEDFFVVISSVDEGTFDKHFTNSSEDSLRKCCKSYDPQQYMVLIEMESEIHASASDAFKKIMVFWLAKSKTLIMSRSTASVRGKLTGIHQGRLKRADGSWRPAEPPSERSTKWPTMVVEIKWSEPTAYLMKDIIFWLDESDGDVKVMIMVSISKRYKITIQRWNLRRRHNQADPIPFPTGKIEISRSPNKKSSHKITGNLTIPFEDVYLRPKEEDYSETVGSKRLWTY